MGTVALTARRDLVAERGNAARLQCRQCGFTFGRLARDRRHPDFTPGVQMLVNLVEQRVELICPRCGTRRSVTDVVFPAMAVPDAPLSPRARLKSQIE